MIGRAISAPPTDCNSSTCPRLFVIRNCGPISDWAAVDPRHTITAGCTVLILGLQPRPARAHLGEARLLVDSALAARLPLEVLHRVGQVDRAATVPRLAARGRAPRPAGPTNGRPSSLRCRRAAPRPALSCGAAPLAEHRLRRVPIEIAPLARGGCGSQGVEVRVLGDERSRARPCRLGRAIHAPSSLTRSVAPPSSTEANQTGGSGHRRTTDARGSDAAYCVRTCGAAGAAETPR